MDLKNERGITLTALVVTTIIMSILVVVSIRIGFIGEHSTVKEVTKETEKQQNMVEEEKNKMSNVISQYEKEWGISG